MGEGRRGKGYLAFLFSLKLESEHLPLAFCLQPSEKSLKVKRKDSLTTVVKYFQFENDAKARNGRKIIIGAKIFGVLFGAHSFLCRVVTRLGQRAWSLHPPGTRPPPQAPAHLLFAFRAFHFAQ